MSDDREKRLEAERLEKISAIERLSRGNNRHLVEIYRMDLRTIEKKLAMLRGEGMDK